MSKHFILIAALALFLIPASAFAQGGPVAEVGAEQTGSDVQYKERTEYDFEGDDVTGSLIKPDGENITGETHGKTSSLINIRADFIPEMLESVEDI
ncbi:hypothetical protein [Bradymonas sediminis]|uniref:Uncharacterized protein n=1 Tax=Bradymonas sediminis TaxID=1548548 RepID=A0A2Z4FN34_9DELT|nr:hypothetical protein [Bradymonas sediminis]AWV90343.1 hypothetical protein DN745_13790 [Bradymonas sediminis]TDP75680.1 hypothetical protein DFR33_10319 [Bradymonas sediminis]